MIIDFNITNFCNAKCPTCARFDINDYLEIQKNLRIKHMQLEQFKNVIERNKIFFRDKFSTFCGEFGDPLMHPQIKEFAEIADSAFRELTIYTNGGLNRKEFFEYVTRTRNDIRVKFGIDGLTHEINNKYRINVNTKLAFDNMKLLSKYGKASWDYTIFEHNKHEIKQVIEFAKDYEIPLMLRCNLRPSRFGVNRISQDDYDQFKELAKKYESDSSKIKFDMFWIN